MELKWTSKALSDLVRLYEFLAVKDTHAAARTVQSLTAVPNRLLDQARIGEKLEEFEPREIRRIIVGRYEMRYEIQHSIITVLRIWHTRDDR
jgi:plasmid stabilization system protein ParE